MTTNGAVDRPGDLDDAIREIETLAEPTLDPLGRAIFERRFLRRGDSGAVETPRERLWRFATAVARGSADYEGQEALSRRRREYYLSMARLEFLPAAATLSAFAPEDGPSAPAACVLSAVATADGMVDLARRVGRIRAAGGAVGVDLGSLRSSSADSTSGPGPLEALELLGCLIRADRAGRADGPGLVATLRVDHPDILPFLDCTGELSRANRTAFETAAPYLGAEQRTALKHALLEAQRPPTVRAVGVTDRFMVALVRGEEYELRDPHSRIVTATVAAREAFNRLVEGAWADGDPSILFVDRINAGSDGEAGGADRVAALAPGGEALRPNEACATGFLNLAKFCRPVVPRSGHVNGSNGLVESGACHAGFTRHPAVDWERLGKATRLGVRFLDDLVSVEPYPDPEIEAASLATRRLALGVMGWADLLVMLEIPYDSQAALELAEEVIGFVAETARDESCQLAEARGAFPTWERGGRAGDRQRRNVAVTSVASSGVVSMIVGCSGGVEPLPSLVVEQRETGARGRRELHPLLAEAARREGFWSEDLADRIHREGSIRPLDDVPERARAIFASTADVSPEWHVRVQAAFQRHCDNAVAKTIALPQGATPDDVERVIRLAYELGCYGVSVYRHGSKGDRAIEHDGTADAPRPVAEPEQLRQRPRLLRGLTYQQETPLGTAYVTVNLDEQGEPFEVFVNQGKTGSDVAAMSVAIGKLASLALRLPSPMSPGQRLRQVADRLRGIGGGSSWGIGPDRARSLPDALARVLDAYLEQREEPDVARRNGHAAEAVPAAQMALPLARTGEFCPECSNGLVFAEGSAKCLACGLVS